MVYPSFSIYTNNFEEEAVSKWNVNTTESLHKKFPVCGPTQKRTADTESVPEIPEQTTTAVSPDWFPYTLGEMVIVRLLNPPPLIVKEKVLAPSIGPPFPGS